MSEVSQDSSTSTAASSNRSDGAPESTSATTTARLPWIGASAVSQQTLELANKVAGSASTVLITGESGAGKDQLARWIHEEGPRRDSPFMKIDCASLPPELVESELFGHEKGAFTGAIATKRGRLEIALSGTIVLDEVAALAPGIQAKLLRVLEERTFERLGGSDLMRLNARLIALTNADLQRAVSAGHFREDLFFRLNVLAIEVPPLRARRRRHSRNRRAFSRTPEHAPQPRDFIFQRFRDAAPRKSRLARKRARTAQCRRARRDFCSGRRAASRGFPGGPAGRTRRTQPAFRLAFARRTRARRHSSHARSHALQNRPHCRSSGREPQDVARDAQEIWTARQVACASRCSAHEDPPGNARQDAHS